MKHVRGVVVALFAVVIGGLLLLSLLMPAERVREAEPTEPKKVHEVQ